MTRDPEGPSAESAPGAPRRASRHEPVMAGQVTELLATAAGGTVFDCTVGDGGHAAELLATLDPPIRLIGIDRDADALDVAAERLAGFEGRFSLVRSGFDRLSAVLEESGVEAVDGVLYDLGVSSPQFDTPERGFSYRVDGPLDMRMDPTDEATAGDVVNGYDLERLTRVIAEYGEESSARRVAEAIVAARPIERTTELAEVIVSAVPARRRRTGGHPARRTFQAIRIEVNRELDRLEESLPQALGALESPGGRLAVLTYHTLEDRVVKRFIADNARGCVCPPQLPVCGCGRSPRLRDVARGGITASKDEIARNRRARSARLRCAERTSVPIDSDPGEAA